MRKLELIISIFIIISFGFFLFRTVFPPLQGNSGNLNDYMDAYMRNTFQQLFLVSYVIIASGTFFIEKKLLYR